MDQNKNGSPVRSSFRNSEYLEEFIKICLIAAAIIVPVRFFIIQPFYVKGASMEPNFYENEYLIVDELSYHFRAPERGEVVVFRYPKTEKRFLIKRVIGLPGDHVVIADSKIVISDVAHPDGFSISEASYLSPTVHTGNFEITLGKDQYFVLGDNREVSLDSEKFGPIDASQIVGRVAFRGLPLNRAKAFEAPNYSNK